MVGTFALKRSDEMRHKKISGETLQPATGHGDGLNCCTAKSKHDTQLRTKLMPACVNRSTLGRRGKLSTATHEAFDR